VVSPLAGNALHEFNASTGTPSHVHAQPMPISIEDLVGLEQSCDAGAGWTRNGAVVTPLSLASQVHAISPMQ
jgi:hypothetical protein